MKALKFIRVALLFAIIWLITLFPASAQGPDSSKITGFKKPVPLPYLRQADVAWSKRIWRIIDLREKFNQPYHFPLEPTAGATSLFDALKSGINSGEISAFSTIDDEFKSKLSLQDIRRKLYRKDTVMMTEITEKGDEVEVQKVITDSISANDIVQYWIKEDFFFDSRRSVLDVRILGICPVRFDEDKQLYIPLFWVYFPQCRNVLVRNFAINDKNDFEKLSYDDLFLKRKFHSFIYKESNVFDRDITAYAVGVDALEEAKRINENMRNFESDLWQY